MQCYTVKVFIRALLVPRSPTVYRTLQIAPIVEKQPYARDRLVSRKAALMSVCFYNGIRLYMSF